MRRDEQSLNSFGFYNPLFTYIDYSLLCLEAQGYLGIICSDTFWDEACLVWYGALPSKISFTVCFSQNQQFSHGLKEKKPKKW